MYEKSFLLGFLNDLDKTTALSLAEWPALYDFDQITDSGFIIFVMSHQPRSFFEIFLVNRMLNPALYYNDNSFVHFIAHNFTLPAFFPASRLSFLSTGGTDYFTFIH
jgi:hypothetical protein